MGVASLKVLRVGESEAKLLVWIEKGEGGLCPYYSNAQEKRSTLCVETNVVATHAYEFGQHNLSSSP